MLTSDPNSKRRLLLVELNEINFDLVRLYIDRYPGRFKFFNSCLSKLLTTSSEDDYQNLEPWIQWPSVHTGKVFNEHGVFRLGDIVHSNQPQIFEELEANGVSVGAFSAMNADNKLRCPAYFIPDPWTKTEPDNSFWSRAISAAVSQAVNDNASSKLTIGSALTLVLALFRFARPKHYSKYIQLALSARGRPWRKALFLDLFLHDVHLSLFLSKAPGFSTLFLNAGAHIQHHYLFNSLASEGCAHLKNPVWYAAEELDPFQEMLDVYDLILQELSSISGTELIIATGLSQKPYDRIKFYYRLKDHERFLRTLDIPFKAVLPRMTRDFLVEFDSIAKATAAENVLRSITVLGSNELLFDEIDNRGSSLFVTLTFPSEITTKTQYLFNGVARDLHSEVAFVAIKNGMHQAKGFAFFSTGIENYAPGDGMHVKEINKTIKKYFGLQGSFS
jgi:hypothetical protein